MYEETVHAYKRPQSMQNMYEYVTSMYFGKHVHLSLLSITAHTPLLLQLLNALWQSCLACAF
jgi:hypothetical protein